MYLFKGHCSTLYTILCTLYCTRKFDHSLVLDPPEAATKTVFEKSTLFLCFPGDLMFTEQIPIFQEPCFCSFFSRYNKARSLTLFWTRKRGHMIKPCRTVIVRAWTMGGVETINLFQQGPYCQQIKLGYFSLHCRLLCMCHVQVLILLKIL